MHKDCRQPLGLRGNKGTGYSLGPPGGTEPDDTFILTQQYIFQTFNLCMRNLCCLNLPNVWQFQGQCFNNCRQVLAYPFSCFLLSFIFLFLFFPPETATVTRMYLLFISVLEYPFSQYIFRFIDLIVIPVSFWTRLRRKFNMYFMTALQSPSSKISHLPF